MKNATFQITPDVIKESENIQLGQDLKLSCHVDAVPQEKVTYQWFKNGKPARMSKRLLVTRNDPELPAVTSSLELIDLHFSDYGTYLCVASFPGAPVPDLSVEVNISSETGGQRKGQPGGVKELEKPPEGRWGNSLGKGSQSGENTICLCHTNLSSIYYMPGAVLGAGGGVVSKVGSALTELSRKANIFQIVSQIYTPANCDT